MLSKRGLWGLIALYIGCIFATLPLARTGLNFLYSLFGPHVLGGMVNALFVLVLLFLGTAFLRQGWRRMLVILLPLLLALGIVLALDRPEERIHFLQYGLLGLLFLKALGGSWRDVGWALVLVVLVGSLDEMVQHFLPNRVGDLRDVAMNAAGGALGLWVGRFWSLR